jgi:hypothetical protein
MATTHSGFIKTILVTLFFLFATICANFWFTVAAYAHNTKSDSSSDLYTSNFGVGSSDDNNNLVTLHNITNKVSLTGEVNVSNLPNLPTSKPDVIVDPNEQYLTRNYTAYINAKKQAELINATNATTTNDIDIQRTDLKLLLPNSSNDSNNKNNVNNSSIINTRFEGLSQVCCIPQIYSWLLVQNM